MQELMSCTSVWLTTNELAFTMDARHTPSAFECHFPEVEDDQIIYEQTPRGPSNPLRHATA